MHAGKKGPHEQEVCAEVFDDDGLVADGGYCARWFFFGGCGSYYYSYYAWYAVCVCICVCVSIRLVLGVTVVYGEFRHAEAHDK